MEGLERALHVKKEEVCLAERWKQDGPDGPDGPDHSNVREYLKLVRIWRSCQPAQAIADGFPGRLLSILPRRVLGAGGLQK